MSGDDKPRDTAQSDGDDREVDETDPEMLAQLMAWFGGSGHEQVVAAEAERLEQIDPELLGTSAEPGISDDERERRALREAALAAVDLTLVSAIESSTEHYAGFVTPPEPPAPVLDASIASFEPDRVAINHGVRARQADPEITEALGHCTPQALLRDLHRVVKRPPSIAMDPVPLGVPKMAGKSTHVAELMATRYVADIDDFPKALPDMRATMAELDERIREQAWDSLDIEPSKEKWQDFPTGDIALWFSGIDPSTLK